MRAEVLAKAGKLDMAIDEMDRMVEDSPDEYIVYDLRSKFYDSIGQHDKAKEDRAQSEKMFMKGNGKSVIQTYQEPSWVPKDSDEEIEKIAQMPLSEILTLTGKLINAEYYSKAIMILTKAVEHNPDSSLIYYLRGKAYIESNESEQAILDFDRSIAFDSSFIWAYFERGKTYLKARRYQKAADDFIKAIEIDPTIAQFHYHKGLAFETSGKEKEQLRAYNDAIEINPEYEEALYSRAWWYRVRGKYAAALSDLDKVLDINPFNRNAKFYRAITLMKMGRTDDAIDGFKMAINQHPDDYNSYMWLGKIQAGKGDFDNAISSFSKCLDILSTSYICMSERGEAYYKTGQYEKAILDFDQYLHTYPDDSSILAMRAKALSSLNPEKSPAVVMFESIEPTMDNYHAYYLAAIESNDVDKLKTAVELLNEVVTVNTGDIMAFHMLGNIYHKMGDSKNAALTMEAGLQDKPGFGGKSKYNPSSQYYIDKLNEATEAIDKFKAIQDLPSSALKYIAPKYSERAYVYMDMGQYKNAIKDLTRALKFDQDVDFWLFKRAESYFELGKHRKALKDINKAISHSKGSQINTMYLILRGRIYQKRKMYKESLEDFNKAVDSFSGKYQDPGVLYFRGVSNNRIQKFSEAYEDLSKSYNASGFTLKSLSDMAN
jgi:tetratricopeptide (TPR) repeat protein